VKEEKAELEREEEREADDVEVMVELDLGSDDSGSEFDGELRSGLPLHDKGGQGENKDSMCERLIIEEP